MTFLNEKPNRPKGRSISCKPIRSADWGVSVFRPENVSPPPQAAGYVFRNQKTFKCKRCGECCRPIVNVDETDVQRIEKSGFKREEFLDYDPMEENPTEKNSIKQKNKVCMFLRRKGNEFFCSIYKHRPKECRIYPFYKENIKDCKPKYLRKQEDLKNLVKEIN